jgi:hypothetical protein
MAELADIKAVDIMNYATEAGYEEYMFDWEDPVWWRTAHKGAVQED